MQENAMLRTCHREYASNARFPGSPGGQGSHIGTVHINRRSEEVTKLGPHIHNEGCSSCSSSLTHKNGCLSMTVIYNKLSQASQLSAKFEQRQ